MNAVATLSELESRFVHYLADRGRINALAVDRLQRLLSETPDQLAAVMLKLGLLSEEALAAALVEFTKLPALPAGRMPHEPVAVGGQLRTSFFRNREIIPIAIDAAHLEIACWDSLDDYALRALEFASASRVSRFVTTRSAILSTLDALYPTEQSNSGSDATANGAHEAEEIDRLKDLASDAPVIRLVQRVINAAIAAKASDIHLEPSREALHVRFRADGLLREVEKQSKDVGAAVVSRLKVMAGLNIAERRVPQDGRIRVTVQGKEVDFRVATSPTLHGESVVLRILDREDIALDFDALGFDAGLQSLLRAAITKPHGIILVTGPTGSGKTTTLYAALKEINTPDKKILTVEDPVEYTLDGINQVPLRPQVGLTFANALRAFLRQDPDVLMVGEIRDRETAEIAIQAALTGHLLLSTLHTNSAAAAITRLLDMGIDDYLLTSTLRVVLAQRLVRRLCAHCKVPYVPNGDMCAESKIWYRAGGCHLCQGSGYKGRTTIIEALSMNDVIRSRVLSRADANTIESVAVEQGMRTLFKHGLERVCAGETSVEEVRRVSSLDH
jgi:general secretion pathway protein E